VPRSAANRQGNVRELSGNFTLSGEWSSWWLLRNTNTKWFVAYWIVSSSMTLIDLQGHFSSRPISLKISVAYFSGLWLSPGDLTISFLTQCLSVTDGCYATRDDVTAVCLHQHSVEDDEVNARRGEAWTESSSWTWQQCCTYLSPRHLGLFYSLISN